MDLAQAYRQAIEESIKWRQQVVERSVANMPTLPVEPIRVGYSVGYEPWLTYPYDRKLMEAIDEALKMQGWTVSFARTEAQCANEWESPRTTYQKDLGNYNRTTLTVEFSDQVDGAVCKRRELGEVPVTQMVKAYDFACPEA